MSTTLIIDICIRQQKMYGTLILSDCFCLFGGFFFWSDYVIVAVIRVFMHLLLLFGVWPISTILLS